jgi:hypothetical protein
MQLDTLSGQRVLLLLLVILVTASACGDDAELASERSEAVLPAHAEERLDTLELSPEERDALRDIYGAAHAGAAAGRDGRAEARGRVDVLLCLKGSLQFFAQWALGWCSSVDSGELRSVTVWGIGLGAGYAGGASALIYSDHGEELQAYDGAGVGAVQNVGGELYLFHSPDYGPAAFASLLFGSRGDITLASLEIRR